MWSGLSAQAREPFFSIKYLKARISPSPQRSMYPRLASDLCVASDDFGPLIVPPPPPKCWCCSCAATPGVWHRGRTSCMLERRSELTYIPSSMTFIFLKRRGEGEHQVDCTPAYEMRFGFWHLIFWAVSKSSALHLCRIV